MEYLSNEVLFRGGFASRQFAQLRAQRGNFIGQTLDLRRPQSTVVLILRVATGPLKGGFCAFCSHYPRLSVDRAGRMLQ